MRRSHADQSMVMFERTGRQGAHASGPRSGRGPGFRYPSRRWHLEHRCGCTRRQQSEIYDPRWVGGGLWQVSANFERLVLGRTGAICSLYSLTITVASSKTKDKARLDATTVKVGTRGRITFAVGICIFENPNVALSLIHI